MLLARFGYLKDCCKVRIRERLLQGLDTWKTAARFGYVITWKAAARFGYVKDCCKVWIPERLLRRCRGLKHTQCGATLETDECTHQQRVASQQPGVRILRCWQQQQSIQSMLMCAFVGFQRSPTLGVLQASMPNTEVFQVFKPCQQQPSYLEDGSFAKLVT